MTMRGLARALNICRRTICEAQLVAICLASICCMAFVSQPCGIMLKMKSSRHNLFCNRSICFPPQPKPIYRQHAASALHQKQPKNKLLRLQDTEDVILALLEKKKTLTLSEQKALERRILQLTTDYLYLTARFTHSYERLTDACERMRRYGLFPLPNKHYTKKYSLFRNLINYSWGRKVILATMLK